MALPQVEERESHGEACWFVDGKKQFAAMSDHHHDDRLAVCFAAAPGVQEALVGEDPRRYYRPPYVGGRGWVGAYLDEQVMGLTVTWDTIEGLLADAWYLVAPARLRDALDSDR
jgi:hypothetical protein